MMNGRQTRKVKSPRGPFKGVRRTMSRLLESKPFLITLSFVVAAVFWTMLVASDNSLTRLRTFPHVAVSVTGESTLKSRGYIVTDDLSELLPSVKMSIEVTQANYNRVSGTSYNPHLDLTKITGEGEAELSVLFSSQLYGPVVSCEPKSVKVNVEQYITRRVPVVIETTGELEGYYLDSAKADPSTLSVSGPKSLVSKVSRAVAVLDKASLTGARLTDRSTIDIRLEDASGGAMASGLISVTNQSVITDSVVVESVLVPMKLVPISLEGAVTGEVAEGYEIISVEAAASALPVAAAQEILDSISALTLMQSLDVSGATHDMIGSVRLTRPLNIENTLPYEVTVTARIREKMMERTFGGVPVQIDGLEDAHDASISVGRQTVLLSGGYGFISALEESDLRLFVDVSGLGVGAHTVPVQIRIDNAPAFSCALSSPEVVVIIEERHAQ